MTSLYHLRSAAHASYRITKLTDDYEVESTYIVSASECTCPAGPRPTCRHRQMLPFFLAKGHVNNGWMLDWHTRQWRLPLCEDGRAEPIGSDFPINKPVDEMTSEELAQAQATFEQGGPVAWIAPITQSEEEDHGSAAASSLEAPTVERSGTAPVGASPFTGMKRRKI